MQLSERSSSITTTFEISTAMLMAAGLGTRLRPYTNQEPKCLIPLMGIPIAQFAIDLLVQAGVKNIVANVHHLADRATAGLTALDLGNAKLKISDERSHLLGSAGGIRKALSLLTEEVSRPFFLLNADVLCNADLKGLARAHSRLRARSGVKLTLMVFSSSSGSGAYREIQFDSSSHLITGLGSIASGKPFFVGVAILEPEALESVPMDGPAEFVPTILEPAIREGKAGVFLSSGEWHDVGSPKLWLETHLALMNLLETRPPLHWSQRVQSVNQRIAPRIWISKGSSQCAHTADWAEPIYWNPMKDETAHPPRVFGPRAVLYGALSNDSVFKNGICFRGLKSE